ncbi:MAG: hypothetical protein DRP47_08240, partial [Candidatus Zixiibacteriota bacterium]
MPKSDTILTALKEFSESVTEKMNQQLMGEPEEQLRAPFESFVEKAAAAMGQKAVLAGETLLADHMGKPDYAIHIKKLLAGYVELKAPGKGAN